MRDTLLLGATALAGLNLLSDPDTLLLMRNNRYLIETSLVSNQLLGYTPDLGSTLFEYLRLEHPGLPQHRRSQGMGFHRRQYFLAVTGYNLSWTEVVALGRNSLAYSFAEPALKKRMLADLDEAVSRFEDRYRTGNWRASLRSAHRPSGYALRFLDLQR